MMSYTENNPQSGSFRLLVHRYWAILIGSIMVMVVLASGLPQLNTVGVGFRNHFSEDDPHLVNLETFEDAYAVSDSLLLVNRTRELRSDFAGAHLLCSGFRANAVYLVLSAIAYNLLCLMRLSLPSAWHGLPITPLL